MRPTVVFAIALVAATIGAAGMYGRQLIAGKESIPVVYPAPVAVPQIIVRQKSTVVKPPDIIIDLGSIQERIDLMIESEFGPWCLNARTIETKTRCFALVEEK